MNVAVEEKAVEEKLLTEFVDQTFSQTFPAKMPGFEPRAQQLEMAQLVARALTEGRHVVVEAGTGTGKTLAYLVPCLGHIYNSLGRRRVVVSTATIALQEQIIYKDIPFLQATLDVPFTAVLAKGRSNYLCLKRLEEEQEAFAGLDLEIERLAAWAGESLTGDRAELNFEPGPAWNRVCADDSCTRRKCKYFEDACFVTRAKKKLANADIIVCNHHLFFADLKVRAESDDYASVLPDYSVVVFDEAHHLEDIALEAFSLEASNYRIPALLNDLKRLGQSQAPYGLINELEWLNQSLFDWFVGLAVKLGSRFGLRDCPKEGAPRDVFARILEDLIGLERYIREEMSFVAEEDVNKAEALAERAGKIRRQLEFILTHREPEYVSWVEVEHNRSVRVTLRATPIDVSDHLRREIFRKVFSVILTSATLAADRSFDYLKRSIGLDEALELVVDSPFDYPAQCLLYIPQHLPDPKAADYTETIAPIIEEILLKTDGRAFVLFTSFKNMNDVYARLAARLRWKVLSQGDRPKHQLLQEFREDGNAVLFATSSFWEGVDVQGEALSCVVLEKLPFAVPTEPIVRAKVEALERAGQNAFLAYSVPQAILRLKQGFGRLIRTRTDRGIVAILDSRIKTKGYGRKFLNSLPPAREIYSLENAELFLKPVIKEGNME